MQGDFRILRGKLSLGKVEGRDVVLAAGDTFTLPAGVFHKPATVGEEPVEFAHTHARAWGGQLRGILRLRGRCPLRFA